MIFFYKESKSKKKKSGRGGGERGGLELVNFFLQKNYNIKKNFFWGGRVRFGGG